MLLQQCLPFTVLKRLCHMVITYSMTFLLQQCLPFTVLKLKSICILSIGFLELQQCLPFTVLKPQHKNKLCRNRYYVATVLTVYGIETFSTKYSFFIISCCNSAYRLRY